MKVHTAVLSLISLAISAQFTVSAAPQPAKQTVASSNVQQQKEVLYTQAQLDQMLAPIALYPDTVLSHVLIAATYPLEIVKATRWLADQPGMTSEQALRAAENQPWDPSVRALVAFSPLLTKMNNDLEWTQRLGDAFLSQEADVMSTVQQLRERAYKAGNLQNQQHIVVERKEKVIVIEPRQREVVYVHVYDTRVVYGDWWWDRYPPVHWPYPRSHGSYVYWGVGARVSPGFYFSTFYWPQRQIVVINNYRPTRYYRASDIYYHEERRHWSHNPHHRHGVVYPRSYRPVVETHGPDNRYDRRYDNDQERRRWSAERRIANDVSVPEDHRMTRPNQDNREYEDTHRQRPNEMHGNDTVRDRDLENLRRAGDDTRGRDTTSGGLPSYTPPASTTPLNEIPGVVDKDLVTDMPIDRSDRDAGRIKQTDPENVGRPVTDDRLGRPEIVGRPEVIRPNPSEEFPRPTEEVDDRGFKNRVIERPEPVLRRDEPVFSNPEPIMQREDPIMRREEPVFSRPEPVIQREEPVFSRPEPVIQREEPVFSRPEPVMQREEPVFSRPEPVMQREEPVFSRPEPVMQREEPVFSRPEPVFERPEPMQSQPVIESGGHIE
jgi:hypothetical protein